MSSGAAGEYSHKSGNSDITDEFTGLSFSQDLRAHWKLLSVTSIPRIELLKYPLGVTDGR